MLGPLSLTGVLEVTDALAHGLGGVYQLHCGVAALQYVYPETPQVISLLINTAMLMHHSHTIQ